MKLEQKCYEAKKVVPNGRAPRFFIGNMKNMFLPRASILSFEGGILLSISLGLAVRIFGSGFEKFPKSASGKIWGGNVLGWGSFWGRKCSEKHCFVEEWFCGGVLGESILPK